MRIGILSLLQESNTFISCPTELSHFEEDLLLEGEAVQQVLGEAHHEVGGFFTGLAEAGVESVPLFAARAVPFGTIRASAFEQLLERMFHQIEAAGLLDGYLVAPHGATVSEAYPDADGHWLQRLRQLVGSDIPIVGTLDLHANLSGTMIEATDALVAYRTNPHVDQRQRGIEAARLLVQALRGEVQLAQAFSHPPMVMNIERQCTSESPCLELYALAEMIRARSGVLSASILQGFPYADVVEMGTSMLVVTDGNPELAQTCASELAGHLWSDREEFTSSGLGIEQAVVQASKLSGRTCLLDMGDNVGGGSPADGTALAHQLHLMCVPRSFVCLHDPASVEQAKFAGEGTRINLCMGGKTDQFHGEPLAVDVEVIGLYKGRFEELEARHGGFTAFDQGLTAVVRTRHDLTIMLTSKRMVPWSLGQFSCCNLNPEDFDVLVAKGVNAPLAAYQPICPNLLRVNTPGVTTADLSLLDYQRRRQPMFPFEPETEWSPHNPVERIRECPDVPPNPILQ
jgi:microcystin degradation protein MlrC